MLQGLQGSTCSLMVLGVQLGEKSSPRGHDGKCELLVMLGLYPTARPVGTNIAPASVGAALPCHSAHVLREHWDTAASCFNNFFLVLIFSVTLCPLLLAHLQLTGKKVEDFQENSNSFSCLSNNRVWISNLQ